MSQEAVIKATTSTGEWYYMSTKDTTDWTRKKAEATQYQLNSAKKLARLFHSEASSDAFKIEVELV